MMEGTAILRVLCGVILTIARKQNAFSFSPCLPTSSGACSSRGSRPETAGEHILGSQARVFQSYYQFSALANTSKHLRAVSGFGEKCITVFSRQATDMLGCHPYGVGCGLCCSLKLVPPQKLPGGVSCERDRDRATIQSTDEPVRRKGVQTRSHELMPTSDYGRR